MSKECGTHEVHRTFKASPEATRGYLSLVMTSITPSDVLRPTIRLSMRNEGGFFYNSALLVDVIKTLRDILGADIVTHVARVFEDRSSAELQVRSEGRGWSELVNALCPREPEDTERLNELFYLPKAA